MKLSNFLRGIDILLRYADDDADGTELGAAYDLIFLSRSYARKVHVTDAARLLELGWYLSDGSEGITEGIWYTEV